jgi:hypothetical protein
LAAVWEIALGAKWIIGLSVASPQAKTTGPHARSNAGLAATLPYLKENPAPTWM